MPYIRFNAGEKTFSMDVQALGAGSYFIKAICPDGCQSQYLRFSKISP
jgi:hypothetical protein